MAKNSKSRRFTYQGKNSVEQHAQRFPYRSTFDEVEKKKVDSIGNTSFGG
ncbi:competence protein [Siminovitchia sediminis]|uniref:Competence protein n=1 Tax=Siminovitchia sediminis TaxID=1274353 RepID=A0ABW4KFZ9_9BACI